MTVVSGLPPSHLQCHWTVHAYCALLGLFQLCVVHAFLSLLPNASLKGYHRVVRMLWPHSQAQCNSLLCGSRTFGPQLTLALPCKHLVHNQKTTKSLTSLTSLSVCRPETRAFLICRVPFPDTLLGIHLAESSFSEEEEEKLQAAFSLEKQELHLVLETISFVLEQAVYHNVKPAALQQQLEMIHLRKDKAEAFASAWSAMGQETVEKFRQRILGPHKLETVGWQLNLQMAHSAQAKLQSPQAVLQLGVSKEDAKNVEKVLVEFNHKELFDFYNKLETIQAQLDSLT